MAFKKTEEARAKLNVGDRSLSPCNVCDVSGDLIGRKHYEAWSNLKNLNENNKKVFILGASSDIGLSIMKIYKSIIIKF